MTMMHNVIFDPIPFKGGSKIATSEALRHCDANQVSFTVLTVDAAFWRSSLLARQHNINIVSLGSLPWLNQQYSGIFYWLNQLYFTAMLLWHFCFLTKVDQVIGASGPGIDMPIYLAQFARRFAIVQLIHGDVATSRSIGWCLTRSQQVFYLPSAYKSIVAAMRSYIQHYTDIEDIDSVLLFHIRANHFYTFVNGIGQENWPSRSKSHSPTCFWCASTLKWKGLDLFVTTLRHLHLTHAIPSHICFIQPKQTSLGVSSAPVVLKHTSWHQDPTNLDEIRRQCNIFISTSAHEPFGLSILEALAAGMCVIIPQDGSYWDRQLTHGVNCLKYQANDTKALSQAILTLFREHDLLLSLQDKAYNIAQQYTAQKAYAQIIASASGTLVEPDFTHQSQLDYE